MLRFAISYHRLREVQAVFLKFAHIPSELNVADILTKPLPPDRFLTLIRPFLFSLPGDHVAQHPVEQRDLVAAEVDTDLFCRDDDTRTVICANPSYGT